VQDKDLETLWTVCSNLETLIYSEPRGDFPQSFYDNLTQAWHVLREQHRAAANALQGEVTP
jgi:hypothetical protein